KAVSPAESEAATAPSCIGAAKVNSAGARPSSLNTWRASACEGPSTAARIHGEDLDASGGTPVAASTATATGSSSKGFNLAACSSKASGLRIDDWASVERCNPALPDRKEARSAPVTPCSVTKA